MYSLVILFFFFILVTGIEKQIVLLLLFYTLKMVRLFVFVKLPSLRQLDAVLWNLLCLQVPHEPLGKRLQVIKAPEASENSLNCQ